MGQSKSNKVEELIADIRDGKMVVLIDDEDRENEGDLVLAADFVTAEAVNFMATEARGLICLAMSSEQIDRLRLPMMVRDDMNMSPNKTAFTVSIEAAQGISTGISAADRAHTIRVAINPNAKVTDVHTPGHVFPIRAQQGGVLKRAGHTEGSVDLARLAGLHSGAVICEVMNADGTMARVPDLIQFAEKHNLKLGTIVDLIEYRLNNESLVEEVSQTKLEPVLGSQLTGGDGIPLLARVFRSRVDHIEHLVIQKGEIKPGQPTLVRMQVDNYSKEFLNTLSSGKSSLTESLKLLSTQTEGVIVLLRGNNRVSGLTEELESYVANGYRFFGMDQRDYGIGAQILRLLGIQQMRLMTNSSEKRVGMKAYHLEIVETVGLDL